MVRPVGHTKRSSRLATLLLSIVQCGSAVVGFTIAWAMFGPVAVQGAVLFSLVSVGVVWGLRLLGGSPLSYGSAVAAGVVLMSWIGIVVVFDAWGLLWVIALGVAGPVRAWLEGGRRGVEQPFAPFGFSPQRTGMDLGGSAPRPATAAPRQLPVLREVSGLDIDGLCLMWQRTYFQLLEPHSTLHTATLVEYRQRILDEMDHRAPSGLQRWLISGPRPSTNPRPFLQSCVGSREVTDMTNGARPHRPVEPGDDGKS